MGAGRDSLPAMAMVVVQLGFAGLNIVSKLAMDAGMNPFVMVAYRQVIATVFLAPFAFFYERCDATVFFSPLLLLQLHSSFCSSLFLQENQDEDDGHSPLPDLPLFYLRVSSLPQICATRTSHVPNLPLITLRLFSSPRATLNQLLYFVGLKLSTPTIACALSNTLPAITFIMAVPFRMETVEVRTKAGAAKVLGTAICVGGSMLMTFYKGSLVRLPPSSIHWRYAEEVAGEVPSAAGAEMVLGAILVVASCFAWAVWFIIQVTVRIVSH